MSGMGRELDLLRTSQACNVDGGSGRRGRRWKDEGEEGYDWMVGSWCRTWRALGDRSTFFPRPCEPGLSVPSTGGVLFNRPTIEHHLSVCDEIRSSKSPAPLMLHADRLIEEPEGGYSKVLSGHW